MKSYNVEKSFLGVRYTQQIVEGCTFGAPVCPCNWLTSDDPDVQRFLPDPLYSIEGGRIERFISLSIKRSLLFKEAIASGDSDTFAEAKAYANFRSLTGFGKLADIWPK